MRRKISLLVLGIMIILQINVFASIGGRHRAGLLVELNSGRILYSKNPDEVLGQASLTKLMTYYVFMDYVKENNMNLQTQIVVKNSENLRKTVPTKLYLNPGDKISVEELINALLIMSANDCAVVMDDLMEGKIVEAMNGKAKSLGMTKTSFVNPHGLTERNGTYNKTSAYDTYILIKSLIEDYPEVIDITSKTSFVYNNRQYNNTNALLKSIEGLDGLKTGYTDIAGYCLVLTQDLTETNGYGKPFKLLSVVLGADSKENRDAESRSLLKHGQDNYFYEKIVDSTDYIRFENNDYKGGYIDGYVGEDVYLYFEKNDNVEIKLCPNKLLPRSIKKGDKIGNIAVINKSDGRVIYTDVFAADDFKKYIFIEKVFLSIFSGFGKYKKLVKNILTI